MEKSRYDLLTDLSEPLKQLKPIEKLPSVIKGGCILLSKKNLEEYFFDNEIILDIQIFLNQEFRKKKMPYRAVIYTLSFPIRIYRKR